MSAPISESGRDRRPNRAWGARARTVAGVIGLMALGAAAAQVSASELQGPDEVVRYSDLDLGTRSGAETLYTRIQRAAARVCRESDFRALTQRMAALRCESQLVAQTVASVPSPQLAAVYQSHRNEHKPV